MTSKYRQFIFQQYHFDPIIKTLELHYSMDEMLFFTEVYKFDFDFIDYDTDQLDRAFQSLFFMAGVSYYKMYLPPEIHIRQGELDEPMAQFFSKTYQKGLAEYWFVNDMDPRTPIPFSANSKTISHALQKPASGLLVAIGGGKDSLVSVELLRKSEDVATWSLNHRPQLTPLIERIGLKHYWVERELDRQLIDLGKQDAFNGHIPISAIFACVGVIVAILSGRRDVVMSNEQSANEATLVHKGVEINHQYSKSQEFEKDFQSILDHRFGDTVRYYSFLRPLSEVHIAELFSKVGYDKYRDVFSSCNRAYVLDSTRMFWDGSCPKCAFVFLALTPFINRESLQTLFDGKNLLLMPELETVFRQLLGIEGSKPLECVGEVKESRSAMMMAQRQYPELKQKYSFELPEDYDYRQLGSHEMPAAIFTLLKNNIG